MTKVTGYSDFKPIALEKVQEQSKMIRKSRVRKIEYIMQTVGYELPESNSKQLASKKIR